MKLTHAVIKDAAGRLVAVGLLLSSAPPALASNEMWDEMFSEQLEAAEAGDREARYEVGIMYLKGQGVEQDRNQAIMWLRRAAEDRYKPAERKLARIEEQQGRFEQSLAEAEAGDVKAQYEVAMMYLKGRGTDRNGELARDWLGKAAASNDIKAIARLGILNYKGEAGSRDYAEALKLFNSISEKDALAQYYLGEMYANGEGVTRDMQAAIEWYTRAADNGFDHAHGKIINLEEELKMIERRKQNTVVAKVEPQPKPEPPPVKKVSKTEKTVPKKPAAAPREAGKKPASSPLDKLTGVHWLRGTRPVDYLPSRVTECEKDKNSLVCLSEVLERVSGNQTVQYRVKSIVTSRANRIVISYRNLVLDVNEIEEADDAPLGYDDNVEKGYKIRTGWTQEHSVDCSSPSTSGLECVKDNTHQLTLVTAD